LVTKSKYDKRACHIHVIIHTGYFVPNVPAYKRSQIMRKVSLKGTSLSTSRLGFGTSGLHQLLRSRKRQDLLAAAFDLGVRHFDTSPYYGHGIAERELGRFARNRRSELLIATKFGLDPDPLLARFPWLMYAQLAVNAAQRRITKQNRLAVTPSRDYSGRGARLSLERSLRVLRTDHVDIYFLHDPTQELLGPNDELIQTLDRLQQEGKARYVGVAGPGRDCIEVAARLPAVAQVFQINATAGAHALDLVRDAGLPCHLSYGHFRNKAAPMKSLLTDAVRDNVDGVILYSSRRASRVAEIVTHLAELERS
jgi:aryl-alcohol dehydrogenase-like predicted oxidoreductase